MSIILRLQNEDGTIVSWEPASQRYHKLEQLYPISQGYQITVTSRSPIFPELLKLYALCIEHGRKPEEYGLPNLPQKENLIFVAELSKDGNLLRRAEVYQPVRKFKDYERGQTAALNRLLELSGIPGKRLVEDELINISELGTEVAGVSWPDDYLSKDSFDDVYPSETSESPTVPSNHEPEPVTPPEEVEDSAPTESVVNQQMALASHVPSSPQAPDPFQLEATSETSASQLEAENESLDPVLLNKAKTRLHQLHNDGKLLDISFEQLKSEDLCLQVLQTKIGDTLEV